MAWRAVGGRAGPRWRCRNFAAVGRGTPGLWDAPPRFVAVGPYRGAGSPGRRACDSLSATVPTWTFSVSVGYVVQDHPVHIPWGHVLAAAHSAIPAQPGGRNATQACAARSLTV